MTGLGLDGFLVHGKDGGSRKFLKDWKKAREIVVWLSTRSAIVYPSFTHPFSTIATREAKDREGNKTGEDEEYMRFNRFVSPDPEIVHHNQYFRDNDNDRMQIPPAKDPFLLLREWLRFEADHLALDATIFEWTNPFNGEVTTWSRGHLARLVDRGKQFWMSTLDTKSEYLFVVADNDDAAAGPQIVRCTKLLGDKMKEEIGKQCKSDGREAGDPQQNPYAFIWNYDPDARSPMNAYTAARYNQAKLTDAIREAITLADFPDPSPDCAPRPGDKARIRAAMQDAAKVDLPWDRLFVDEWVDKEPEGGTGTDFNFGNNKGEPAAADKAPESTGHQQSVDTGTPKARRRKKVDKPKEPEVEMIPCDDCQTPLPVTATKCPKCGAEYEVGDDEQETPAASTAAPAAAGGAVKCWSCGSANIRDDRCGDCGLDITDDIPF